MIRALSNAASGMKAQELNIDILSNNLANVNTAGYKRARAEFADLFYEAKRRPGAPSPDGTPIPVGLEIGHGVRPVATHKNFSGGEMRETGNPLDISIEGRGFFQVSQPDGTYAFTRAGVLKTNSEGQVVNADGYALDPELSIPEDATSISVSENGVVSVTLGGDNQQVEVGQIQIATFPNPAGLSSAGRNLYTETPASGRAVLGTAGEEGSGRLLQGFVESSNVAVVGEMIDLIAAQRAYEINSKVIQAADHMLQQTTRLGR
ncbi:MAG: flagellar basal-body rod protein FlgG [Deltaproteobacteria bacterium]|nr:flagellar basal-body rod protein FlgG [Deltaproteobacteria bacterium]